MGFFFYFIIIMDHHGDIGVFVLGDHKVDTIPVASSINLNRLTLTRLLREYPSYPMLINRNICRGKHDEHW